MLSLLPSADNEYGRRGRGWGWGWKGWNRVMRGEEEGEVSTLLLRRRCSNPPLYPSLLLPSPPSPPSFHSNLVSSHPHLLSIPPPSTLVAHEDSQRWDAIPSLLILPFLTSNRSGMILLPSYPLCHGGIRRSLSCER